VSSETGIRAISLVIVPVTDQDRSVDYYERIGLEKRVDTPFGGDLRWIEVYAPEGTTGISLATPRPGDAVVPTQTGITLATPDIDGTYAQLVANGIDVDPEIMRMGGPVPPMFWLRDPDGHSLLVVGPPAE
jgi:catechol 2,3-dioxygenase-like lactoylglutathione lyase family enzyme